MEFDSKSVDANSKQFAKGLRDKWVLVLCLTAIGTIVFVSYFYGPQITSHALTTTSIVASGFFAALTLNLIPKSKNKQDTVITSLFGCFGALWFLSELIRAYTEEILQIKRYPSWSDPFWLAGEVALFVYLIIVLKPAREFISKKILVLSSLLSTSLLTPSIIAIFQTGDVVNFSVLLSFLYTIIDSILLVPLVMGVVIYQKLEKNYFWILTAAIILNVATDTVFLFSQITNFYYAGHPLRLGYGVAYAIMAYGAHKQNQVMKKNPLPIIEQIRLTIPKDESAKSLFVAPLIIATAVTIFSLSILQIYPLERLSAREITIISPILYGSIITVLILCAGIVIIGKKSTTLKSKMRMLQSAQTVQPIEETMKEPRKYKEIELEKILASETLVLMQKKLNNIEKTGKNTTYAVLLVSLVVAGIFSFYMYGELFQPSAALTPGRFIIENLKGQPINTWAAWYVPKESVLHVSIVNSNLLPKEKINVIRNAILSEETIETSKSALVGTSAIKHVDYVGWKGALKKTSENETSWYIPKDFEIEESDKPVGKILIILSKSSQESGALAVTRSIADENNHQILKSFVTIYDVENLNDKELSSIVRHEFGHALGLPESNKEDAYHKIEQATSYISECEIGGIISLYDEQNPASVCE
ncbi:MAG: hypothetical protein EPO62_00650 [Candidatus Nitrosotenuis sp.]|nr:MAG: hypothetical protein EPO62_00650 [Candidatus Nitrosotenuis sp.]